MHRLFSKQWTDQGQKRKHPTGGHFDVSTVHPADIRSPGQTAGERRQTSKGNCCGLRDGERGPFTDEDLPGIEEEMRRIIRADTPLVREVWSREQVRDHFEKQGEAFKAEWVMELPADETISMYRTGEWIDLGIEVPPSPLTAVCSHEVWEEIYERMAELVREHRTTLVFVNTRKMAERIAARLGTRLGAKRVCMTRAEWDDRKLQDQQELTRVQTQRSGPNGN